MVGLLCPACLRSQAEIWVLLPHDYHVLVTCSNHHACKAAVLLDSELSQLSSCGGRWEPSHNTVFTCDDSRAPPVPALMS